MGLSPTPPEVYNDGGFQTGSYDAVINGKPYTLDTADQDLPVSQADAYKANGTAKGGAYVLGKQKFAVKANAVTGVPKPAQLVPFQIPEVSESAWWILTNLKISSSNSGAQIRTYSGDLVQLINAPSTT